MREGSSPSVLPHAFLHDDWMDFRHIGYHDQVEWAADVSKIEFGSVPNWSNFGFKKNTFTVFIVISQRRSFFIFGTVITHDALLMLVK